MLTHKLSQIEKVVSLALEQAATDYTRDRGRFVPFAEKRIHEALTDYDKTLRRLPREVRTHYGPVRKIDGKLNIAAFRRGLMMA